MAQFVPRSITFTIPAKNGYAVQITAVENAGNLDFTADVLGKPSTGLEKLFFSLVDVSDLGFLKVLDANGLITGTQSHANGTINLGQGGIPFSAPGKGKDVTGPVHFTLDATHDLTVDDIANVSFGALLSKFGDKFTFRAPAAPDAKDDTATTHEDTAITIPVLANDTNTGIDGLTITAVQLGTGAHGTVQIAANGKSIVYTPDKDYAGTGADPNSADAVFQYAVSDGNGGQDSASVKVHVIPVADKPIVTFEVLTPHSDDPINMVRLKVTATQADADGSEFIDRIAFDKVPDGVTLTTDGVLTTTGQPGSATEEVQLLLPTGTSLDFNFTATAYAQEKGIGDPDEASGSASAPIKIDFNHNETQKDFLAQNQSIWGAGTAFTIDKDFFLGPNVPLDANFGVAATSGHFKAGLSAEIHLQGGAINAHIPFDITVETTYNRTTDTLDIHTGATLESGGGFTTTGPEGNFSLGALLDFALSVDLIDPTGISDPTNLFNFSTPTNVLSGSLVAFSSTSPDLPITLADTPFGSIKVDWPHLSTTTTTQSGDMISGSATSNNIVTVTADLDAFAAHFFPIFQPVEEFIGPDVTDPDPESTFQWLDVKADLGGNLLQDFLLKVLGLNGTLTFEDGTTKQIVLGGPDIVINHASSLEGGDLNKTIDFLLSLTPNATLDNKTSIGLATSGTLFIAKNAGLFDPLTVPLFSAPIANIPIDDDVFTVGFTGQSYDFVV